MSPDIPQVATHFRCALHDVELPTTAYYRHVRDDHDGQQIAITLVWRDA